MAEVSIILPKLHVFFKTNKTPQQVRTEILGPLANGYENLIQAILDNAGQTGLTAEVIRNRGKVDHDGSRWSVYLKCWLHGTTTLNSSQLRTAWANKKTQIKSQIKTRLERPAFGGAEIRFSFKRLDGGETSEEQ